MAGTAKLDVNGKTLEMPVTVGSEGEVAFDISKLRGSTGAITLDYGYGNTGSTESAITFLDGEEGVLRYRGYPIEELAESSSFLEVSYLLFHGELPTKAQLDAFVNGINDEALVNEGYKEFIRAMPPTTHPMAMISAGIAALSGFYPDIDHMSPEGAARAYRLMMGKLPTLAAWGYKHSQGEPFVYPDSSMSYCENFLHMMFADPRQAYKVHPEVAHALDVLLILHADHEQNCSTSTVRMVGSSQANLFASISAGVGALWGPLHGGANQAVLEMLQQIRAEDMKISDFVAKVKDKSSTIRLMGFGHRVYKNFDARARILKVFADKVLHLLGIQNPLLDLAKEIEEYALKDDYFVERKLYPNVDFYSGIIYSALGIPVEMMTVMFTLGRLPGWTAHWQEANLSSKTRIGRPRQVYTGSTKRPYVPMNKR